MGRGGDVGVGTGITSKPPALNTSKSSSHGLRIGVSQYIMMPREPAVGGRKGMNVASMCVGLSSYSDDGDER